MELGGIEPPTSSIPIAVPAEPVKAAATKAPAAATEAPQKEQAAPKAPDVPESGITYMDAAVEIASLKDPDNQSDITVYEWTTLAAEFEANGIAATSKYVDETIFLLGIVHHIEPHYFYDWKDIDLAKELPTVTFMEAEYLDYFFCGLHEASQIEKLGEIRKGDIVLIEAKVLHWDKYMGLYADSCLLGAAWEPPTE